MKILILGDVGPSDSNCQAFLDAEEDLFSADIQSMCAEADIVLLNLEKPLTDMITPLGKCPPDYYAPAKAINGIRLLHPTAVTLANNHIMDQQTQGLSSTIEVLVRNGIRYVGAGNDAAEARRPIILDGIDYRIGVYACCEKEFSFATKNRAGANVFDPLETLDEIQDLKKTCDYLIVLYHGGMQGYPYPTPYQQRVCRRMCEKGADLVICQHSHVIGCEEEYKNGRIVYGQGNFLLDDVPDESWQSGVIVEVTLETDHATVAYVPTRVQNHKLVMHPDAERVRKCFCDRSQEIKETESVDELFSEFCDSRLSEYLLKLSGKCEFLQRVFRRIGITKHYRKLYSAKECNRILDYLYCDAHREAIEYGLNKFIQDIENKKRKT